MNSEQIEVLADRIIALINSQLRSPTRVEIVNTILSVNCDPKLQQPPSDMQTLTTGQTPSHAITTTNGIGLTVSGGHYAPATGGDIYSVLTMSDVLKIACDEAEHANQMFAYAGLDFSAKLDPHTENVMVVAERAYTRALGFAVTHKAIVAPDAAAIKSAIGVQCFRLGELMLGAVPEGFFHS